MWEANGRVVTQPAVAGWDERLRSPAHNLDNVRRPQLLLTPKRDQASLSPKFGDVNIPSYQFSDSCFSIDLLNSYVTCENRDAQPEPCIEAKIRFGNVALASKKQLDPSIKKVNNPLYGRPESWLDATPEEDNHALGGRKMMGQGGSVSRSNLTEQRSKKADASPKSFHEDIFLSCLFLQLFFFIHSLTTFSS